jgi:hypothetical protein
MVRRLRQRCWQRRLLLLLLSPSSVETAAATVTSSVAWADDVDAAPDEEDKTLPKFWSEARGLAGAVAASD